MAAGDTNDISSKTCSEPPCLLDRYTRFVPPLDTTARANSPQGYLGFFRKPSPDGTGTLPMIDLARTNLCAPSHAITRGYDSSNLRRLQNSTAIATTPRINLAVDPTDIPEDEASNGAVGFGNQGSVE